MSLELELAQTAEGQSLKVVGEVDISNAQELREKLEAASAEAPELLQVNMAEVPYIDSTGIGVLVGAAHRAEEAGRKFELVQVQPKVLRIIALLNLEEALGVVGEK